MIYKVLPMWQPWAQLVVIGAKKLETRSRDTKVRGTVLIHACLKWNADLEKMCYQQPFYKTIGEYFDKTEWPDNGSLKFGHIIGAVDLLETFEIFEAKQEWNLPGGVSIGETYCLKERTPGVNRIIIPSTKELAFGNYAPGRFAWKLENHRMLKEPIPFKGTQGWGKFETDKELEFI